MTGAAIQIILKNDHGCDFVNVFTPFSPVETHLFEVLLGGKTGKTFIPKYNGNVQLFAKLDCEAGHFLALAAFFPIHMQGLAHNYFMHFVFLNEAAQKCNIGLKIFSLDCWPTLCRQEECVTNGNTDGFVTNIEGHNPHIFMIQPQFTGL
jgi:hypothetical protein